MSNSDPSLSDVVERRRRLREQIDSLRGEDTKLEWVENVLRDMKDGASVSKFKPVTDSGDPLFRGQVSGSKPPTVEEMIVKSLKESENPWWTSGKLRETISKLVGREVPMGTVGPTLSQMKGKGVITRDGYKVALKERVPAAPDDPDDNFDEELAAIEPEIQIAAQ